MGVNFSSFIWKFRNYQKTFVWKKYEKYQKYYEKFNAPTENFPLGKQQIFSGENGWEIFKTLLQNMLPLKKNNLFAELGLV